MILQQPKDLETAENFARLRGSVLASPDKAATCDAKEIADRIVEELSKTTMPNAKQTGDVCRQVMDINESDIKGMIRTEFEQLMKNMSPKTNSSFRRSTGPGFQSRKDQYHRGVPTCYNRGRKGHTYSFCRLQRDMTIPCYNCNRQYSSFSTRRSQNSFHWNTEQGNGLVPLSLVEIMA